MNHSHLAHLWAQQSAESRRCGTMFFDGATIYSYGLHFPIASFVDHHGERAILFTTKSYSNSTAKHKLHAWRAAYGLSVPLFYVKDVTLPRSDVIREDYKARITEAALLAARARSRGPSIIEHANNLAKEANKCAAFFGWRWRLTVPEVSQEQLAKMRAAAAAASKKQRDDNAHRAEIASKDLADRVTQWRAGADVSLHGYHLYGRDVENPVMLRVQGEQIQTSRGALIPLAHAPRLWRVIQRAREGTPYHHNGHSEHAGEFRIDSIDTAGTLRAGCHVIEYAELERMAHALHLGAA